MKIKVRMGPSPEDRSSTQQIDAIISEHRDWQGKTLSQLLALVKRANPAIVEEVKWKKPTNPNGVPVWSHDGIVCTGGMLKNAVRLTFLKGVQLKDPKKLFNASLEGNALRAIDLHEDDNVNEAALRALILEAMELNTSKVRGR